MANIFRGPLYVGRREVAPVLQLGALAVTSLLATTLATAPLPVGAQSFPLQVRFAPGLTPNADTSHGTPKTLTADAQLPFRVLPQSVADPIRPVTDATRGTSLALITVPAPFVPVLHSAPARSLWLPGDESVGSPKGLIPDKQLPFPPQVQTQPDRLRPVVDTSQDTPKPLIADKQAPFFVAPPPGPIATPYLPFDTSLEMQASLRTLVPPFVPGPHYPPPRLLWLPADESAGTAKPLFADKQLPFSNPPIPALDKQRIVVDTSQAAYATTKPIVVVALPPGLALSFASLQYPGQVSDTTSHLQPADVIPPPDRPTWGTFPDWPKKQHYPEWWPSRKKKLEDDFKEEVKEILEAADLPAKPEQIIRELSAELARDKIETAQLRRAVQARLTAEKVKNTAAAKEAVAKIAKAKAETEAKAIEYERMEVERKKVRRKKITHILRMLH